jgi:hypothetical protein
VYYAINKSDHHGMLTELMNIRDINENDLENKIIFVDASIYSHLGGFTFEFFQLIVFFLIILISFLYLVLKFITTADFRANILLPANMISVIIFVFVMAVPFLMVRKYWTFKIIAADKGIILIGLLKRKVLKWDDITSLDTLNTAIPLNIGIARLTTKYGKYYFPLTMKGEHEKYPELSGQLMNFVWKDADGHSKGISLENCPLYLEIKRQLKGIQR